MDDEDVVEEAVDNLEAMIYDVPEDLKAALLGYGVVQSKMLIELIQIVVDSRVGEKAKEAFYDDAFPAKGRVLAAYVAEMFDVKGLTPEYAEGYTPNTTNEGKANGNSKERPARDPGDSDPGEALGGPESEIDPELLAD